MSAKILDGKILAASFQEQLSSEVSGLCKKTQSIPSVVNLLVGNDPAAVAYADSQKKLAEEIGIRYERVVFDKNVALEELLRKIDEFNAASDVSGIMIHKPLPDHLAEQDVFPRIDPAKDVEGLNAANMGNLLAGAEAVIPATAAAVMELVKASGITLRGKDVVVIGESEIVGRPLTMLLLNALATVTVCHIGTAEAGKLEEHVKRADIVIVAVGKSRLISGGMVKEGAAVIDVGINCIDGRIVGDVEFESVKEKAGVITPVPGGVGPLTSVMMMKNIVNCFKRFHGVS